ncbi:putative ATP-grasp-modified RiPP [Streptomyces sp. BBFR102]|uniref:putative ATP-grasp-modified RiPP n=1 Tax=Streptomyces sp. BBFR102 TaxID=3448171 RepID=UPI003F532134
MTITPFALRFARPQADEPAAPYAFDRTEQVNVLADGGYAAEDTALLARLGSTASTAGSKTHWDD